MPEMTPRQKCPDIWAAIYAAQFVKLGATSGVARSAAQIADIGTLAALEIFEEQNRKRDS